MTQPAPGAAPKIMEKKTARLTLLIDPDKKAAFERLCAAQDLTASQVIRQLIREYLARHGVSYPTQPKIGKGGGATSEASRPDEDER